MSSIRGVSVGGNLYDVADTTNIAPKEPTGFASREYEVGRTFIMSDGLLYKATEHIAVGDAIVVNGNAERTNVDKLFEATENVEAIPTMLNVLGAKNLLPNMATSKVENNVTFVVNDDGSITVSTTSSGASAATQMDIGDSPVGTYHLSGCPSGGSADTYSLYVSGQYLYETGDGLDINFTASRRVMIMIKSGTVINTPITFKPMIRPTSIADDTYVPYAMTNAELGKVYTENFTLSGFDGTFRCQRVGKICFITYTGTASSLAQGALSFSRVLPKMFIPAITTELYTDSTSNTFGVTVVLQLNADGTISGYNYSDAISSRVSCKFGTVSYIAKY